MKHIIRLPEHDCFIKPELIGLPTQGAHITNVISVRKEENGLRTGDFYRISGAIHPADQNGYDIRFQAGFPVEWNGRVLQYGGGLLDGYVAPAEQLSIGQDPTGPSQLSKGYITVCCDSGHTALENDPWSCAWALNREALENFAFKAFKKVRDVIICLAEEIYGEKPSYIYFAGASNGGREALKVIQNFPADYDGAVCLYPVVNYILKVIKDSRIGTKLNKLGEDAVISKKQYERVQQTIMNICDSIDGAEDGIISDLVGARAKKDEIRTALSSFLNEKQIAFLDIMAEETALSYPMAYGAKRFPGYDVYSGVPLIDSFTNWYGSSAEARDNGFVIGCDNVIRGMIMQDLSTDPITFDPEAHQEAVLAASAVIDAYNTDLDAFRSRGGKLLFLHGMTDSLVPVQSSIDYYEDLKARYGEKVLDTFVRFYSVPGYGHGQGDMFTMDIDLIAVLHAWVSEGNAPDTLIAADSNDKEHHRRRPLYPYPAYPVYNGEGDPNLAESFHISSRKES